MTTVNITHELPEPPPYEPMAYWDTLWKARAAVREVLRYLIVPLTGLFWAETVRRRYPDLGFAMYVVVLSLSSIWLSMESAHDIKRRIRQRDEFERLRAASAVAQALIEAVAWTAQFNPRWQDGELIYNDVTVPDLALPIREMGPLLLVDSQRITELSYQWRDAGMAAWGAFQRLRALPPITEANKEEFAAEVAEVDQRIHDVDDVCQRFSDAVFEMARTPRRRWFRRSR